MADLHTSEITLRVGLDENRIPESLNWSAQELVVSKMKKVKANANCL